MDIYEQSALYHNLCRLLFDSVYNSLPQEIFVKFCIALAEDPMVDEDLYDEAFEIIDHHETFEMIDHHEEFESTREGDSFTLEQAYAFLAESWATAARSFGFEKVAAAVPDILKTPENIEFLRGVNSDIADWVEVAAKLNED